MSDPRLDRAIAILSILSLSSCGSQPLANTAPRSAPGGDLPIAAQVDALRAEPVVLADSSPVGTLPGDSSVSRSGQPVYTIPLAVSPGVRGMTPSVSLSYGGTSSNGPLGVGFRLSTTEAPIARCNETIAQDGRAERFAFEVTDPLCWGGQRLILESGSYGEDGAEYRTRRNPYDKIVQQGATYLPGSYFEVYRKSGEILTFGEPGSTLFRMEDGTEQAFRWAQSRASDRFGNEIEYIYDAPTLPGEVEPYALNLTEIAYGGTGSDESRRRVRLEYTPRTDISRGFFRGVEFIADQRVQAVVAEGSSGQVMATYRFEYDQDPVSGLSRLLSVEHCDAGSPEVCLPPTTFDWIQPEAGIPFGFVPYHEFEAPEANPDSHIPFVGSPNRLVGDFDGDGDHDVVFWTPNGWHAWDGYSTNMLDDNGITLSHPIALPEGNQVVIDDIDNGLGAGWIRQHLDQLQPAFGFRTFNANGDARADLLIPHRNLILDEPESVDAWGYRYAAGITVATASTPEGEEPAAGFTEPVHFIETDAGLGSDPIYTVVPLDHNGDGLGDLWVCQGPGFKSGHWVLAINAPIEGAAPGQFGFTTYDSGVGCSVHDELLVTSLNGGGEDLLVVPAFETGPDMPMPHDFGTVEEYDSDYGARPEIERTEYLALSFTPGEAEGTLVGTGLPRDHYQRWHDRECRNGLADHFYGRPLAGAGLGADKLADVNGDGLIDVVRFELAGGDTTANPDLFLGLDLVDPVGQVSWDSGIICDDDIETDLVAFMRPYINTGEGFVAGDPIHDFLGNAHANLWLNFRAAQMFDFNLDGLTDFLLPSGGEGGDWTVVTSAGGGNYLDHPIGLPEGWPSYSDDAAWLDDMEQSRELAMLALMPLVDQPPIVSFLGHVEEAPAEWGGLINALTTSYDGPHHRVGRIVDGLGAAVDFEYKRISMTGPAARRGPLDYPRGGGRTAKTVVHRQHVQATPDGQAITTTYRFEEPVVDRWGRGFVGFRVVESELPEGGRERVEYNLDRDAALADYPFAGTPSTVYKQELHAKVGYEPEYWVTRTTVDPQLEVQQRLGGSTYFAYPATTTIETFIRSEACIDDCELSAGDHFRTKTVQEQRDEFGSVLWSHAESEVDSATMTVDAIHNDEANWIVGKPLEWTSTSCVSGECADRTFKAVIDPTTGVQQTLTIQPDDPTTRLQTTYVYDGHGNPITTTRQSADGEIRETTGVWNAEGTFIESMTNAVGHQSWVIHDPVSGNVVAQVQSDGLTSVTSYDGFYRAVETARRVSPIGATDGFRVRTSFEPGGPLYDENSVEESAMRIRTIAADGQEEVTDYGPTGRVLQSSWWGMSALAEPPLTTPGHGDEVYVSTLYDEYGRPERASVGTWAGEQPAGYTQTTYDQMDRVASTIAPNGVEQTVSYSHGGIMRRVQTTDGSGATTTTRIDPAGRTREVIDALGTKTCYEYGPFGVLESVRRDCDDDDTLWVDTFEHDALGRVLVETSVDRGPRTTTYNAFGEVLTTTDADGNTTTFHYDALGRVEVMHDPDGDTTFTYDTTRPGYLDEEESPDGIRTSYTYDESGRKRTVTVADLLLEGPAELAFTYDYGIADELIAVAYPSVSGSPSVAVQYNYDDAGYLRWVARDSGELLWSALEASATSQLTLEEFGNGLQTRREYETLTDLPTSIITTNDGVVTQSLGYEWHPWSEVESRRDDVAKQEEAFLYDALHRLTDATVYDGESEVTNSVGYDAVGNITSKTDVGGYVYEDGRLRAYGGVFPALVDYDDRGNIIADGSKSFTYTPFNKVRQIVDGAETLDFRYAADGSRYLRRSQLDEDEVINVGRAFELRRRLGSVELSHRVEVAGRVVSTIRQERVWQGWDESIEYTHGDRLESTNMTSDESGAVASRLSNDPWGRARDGEHWTQAADDALLDRIGVGFTGHRSQLDADLIDMGGRMYHPELARFFSPDPIVVDPHDAQTYNRYSYVHNRPLVATDPSGYEADFVDMSLALLAECTADPACDEAIAGFRVIVVRDPNNPGDDLDRYNTMNGGGNGGPGLYSQFNPHAASNPLRRPGFGPGFDPRFAVSREMCELMAGCMPDTRPKRCTTVFCAMDEINQAAETAVDFIPILGAVGAGVDIADAIAEGKGAGEVLAIAGEAIVLGALPGGRTGKKAVKALNKAEKVQAGAKAAAKQCFAAGTLVETAEGPMPIEDVEVGDYVWSRDDKTGAEGWNPVERLFVTPDQEVLELTFVDRGGDFETLRVTGEHPLWSLDDGAWDHAKHLELGEWVDALDGPMALVGAVSVPGTETVYNFEVAQTHTYFVGDNGVWSHNNCATKAAGKVGGLPKPPRGRGSVPASQRDPKRFFSPSERSAKRAAQGNACAGCGTKIDASNSRGHHIKRHADGGKTTNANHAEVCVDCHLELHRP